MDLTPSKNSPNISRSVVSPLSISESPVALMKVKGNLTGNARVIRDNCANICNLSSKWTDLNLKGSDILIKIINLKTNSQTNQKALGVEAIYPRGLEELVDELEKNFCSMMAVVNEMVLCKNHLNGVDKLEKFQKKGAEPIFISWPTSKFGQVADSITSTFSKELEVKRLIKEKIAHEQSKTVSLFFYSCWFYELYCDSNLREEIFCMATEVGFKQ